MTTRKLTIEHLHQAAAEKGGRCLSTEYVGSMQPTIWECANGHRFSASANAIRSKGTWCGKCHISTEREKKRVKRISEMRPIAETKGFTLVPGYSINPEYIWLQCPEGHAFHQNMRTLAADQRGCPTCTNRIRKLTIYDLRQIAAERGGVSLSTEYKTVDDKYDWQCKFGHEFKMSAHVVRSDQWCPTCARGRRAFESVKKRVAKMSGQCLTKNRMESCGSNAIKDTNGR